MNYLIERLLKKRGIETVDQLDDEEKEMFDRWEKVLTTEPITIETMGIFLKEQKARAEDGIANPDNSRERDIYFKALLTLSRSLLGLMSSTKVEKEALEKHLKQLLNQ